MIFWFSDKENMAYILEKVMKVFGNNFEEVFYIFWWNFMKIEKILENFKRNWEKDFK